MPTTVTKVNGLSPTEWLADPNNVYAGRSYEIRNGRHVGETWHTSGWGNPFRFQDHFGRAEKCDLLFKYVRELALKLQNNGGLLRAFKELPGRNLGCWCTDWDGTGNVPLCHACWLARIVDTMFEEDLEVMCPTAVVYPTGEITRYGEPRISSPGIIMEIRDGKFVTWEVVAS